MSVDVHQHLWPAPFLAALRARGRPPRLDGWTLELAEGTYPIDPVAHDVDARAAAALNEGLELVAVAPSMALGIDRLPFEEAAELAEAWLQGALALPRPFRAWAAPASGAAAIARGAIGVELPADALLDLDGVAPLLGELEGRQAPVLVHPGPAPPAPGRPSWWAAVVPYVTGLHAAWWAWADGGRERYPSLPVLFAALAGLGPLHGERQRARGGEDEAVDVLTFVETSSYGTLAVDAVIRVLGVDVVCHGSDRPYAEPATLALDAAALHAISSRNPQRLLVHALEEVPA
jgi:6-methylsalicylate decarboxylase